MHHSMKTCLRALALAGAITGSLFAQAPAGRGGGRAGRGGGSLLDQAGATDKHFVDPEAAERGKKIYIAECITCHGPSARGGQGGPDLVRSLVVLHDRYGSEIGPLMTKGHPTQSTPSAKLSKAQVEDLSHFVHLKVNDTLRTSPLFHAQDVLTGDAKAGEAYFNGDGKCSQCHSATGDLKGIGAKYDPIDMQQKFLFPKPAFGRGGRGGPRPTIVTVTPPSGPAMTGTLERIDDFNVSLRDKDGEYHAWTRTPQLKVRIEDPYQAHAELLDRITDKNMHDMTAYLETLK